MKNRLFQYRLRTLLLVFVLCALLLGQITAPLRFGLRRREMQRKLIGLGAFVTTEHCDIGWMRVLLPEEASEEVVKIDFSNCKPTEDYLSLLQWCPRVRKLELAGSEFGDAGFQHVAALKDLQELVVDGDKTQIDDRSLVHLAELRHLKILDLSDSNVTGTGFANLDSLRNLESLSLDNCPVSDDSIVGLANLRNLRHLGLSGTMITDEGLCHLGKFNKLDRLGLRNTEISDQGLSVLSSLVCLERLYVGGTRVTDSGIEHLCRLHNLEVLSLTETSITNASVPCLMSLTNLRCLWLDGTAVTPKGASELWKLPNIEDLSYDFEFSDSWYSSSTPEEEADVGSDNRGKRKGVGGKVDILDPVQPGASD